MALPCSRRQESLYTSPSEHPSKQAASAPASGSSSSSLPLALPLPMVSPSHFPAAVSLSGHIVLDPWKLCVFAPVLILGLWAGAQHKRDGLDFCGLTCRRYFSLPGCLLNTQLNFPQF